MYRALTFLAVGLFWFSCNSLLAQDPESDESISQRLAEIRSIEKGCQSALDEFWSKLKELKPGKERDKLLANAPKRDDWAEKAMKLIEESPADKASERAIRWVLKNTAKPWFTNRCKELIQEHHSQSSLVGFLYSSRGTKKNLAQLEEALESSQNQVAKAYIHKYLCVLLRSLSNQKSYYELHREIGDFDEISKRINPEYIDWIDSFDRDQLATRIERELTLLSEQYSAIENGSFETWAKNVLREIRSVGLARSAPEIKGQDSDGKEFRLSDYRGQVVVLHFWGST